MIGTAERRRRGTRALLGLTMLTMLTTLPLAAGCTTSDGPAGSDTRGLNVLAAASLTEPFEELERRFETDHPGVDVRLVLDSSATLAAQAVDGAPADVLATADSRTMQLAVEGGATAAPPQVFARNRLVLVVPAGNPAGIAALEDLEGGVDYVACVETAPCGALAQEVIARTGLRRPPSSLEVDVKAVLQKVVLDEADAGLVYASDAVAAAEAVEEVPLPEGAAVFTDYPIAPVVQAAQPELAAAWIDLVGSAEGRAALETTGFLVPRGPS